MNILILFGIIIAIIVFLIIFGTTLRFLQVVLGGVWFLIKPALKVIFWICLILFIISAFIYS
jgi:hypothetical protein